MSKIKFSDGVEIDTSGKYRIICVSDGCFVVGEGFLCPVDDREDGEDLIKELNKDKGEGQ